MGNVLEKDGQRFAYCCPLFNWRIQELFCFCTHGIILTFKNEAFKKYFVSCVHIYTHENTKYILHRIADYIQN